MSSDDKDSSWDPKKLFLSTNNMELEDGNILVMQWNFLLFDYDILGLRLAG